MSATTLSEVFHDAQKYLWDGANWSAFNIGKQNYICHAIEAVRADRKLIKAARKVVTDAIHPTTNLDNWLYAQGVYDIHFCSDESIQAHRLQWLKMLEAQFKEA